MMEINTGNTASGQKKILEAGGDTSILASLPERVSRSTVQLYTSQFASDRLEKAPHRSAARCEF
jgi:hypothetical protein